MYWPHALRKSDRKALRTLIREGVLGGPDR
jgi:hypothetical protein